MKNMKFDFSNQARVRQILAKPVEHFAERNNEKNRAGFEAVAK